MLALAGQDLPREQAAFAAALMALYPFGFFRPGRFYREPVFAAEPFVHAVCPPGQLARRRGFRGAGRPLPQPGPRAAFAPFLPLAAGPQGKKSRAPPPWRWPCPFWAGAAISPSTGGFSAAPSPFLNFWPRPPGTRPPGGSAKTWPSTGRWPSTTPASPPLSTTPSWRSIRRHGPAFFRPLEKMPHPWLIWGGGYLGMSYPGRLAHQRRALCLRLPAPLSHRGQPAPPCPLAAGGGERLFPLEDGRVLHAGAGNYVIT